MPATRLALSIKDLLKVSQPNTQKSERSIRDCPRLHSSHGPEPRFKSSPVQLPALCSTQCITISQTWVVFRGVLSEYNSFKKLLFILNWFLLVASCFYNVVLVPLYSKVNQLYFYSDILKTGVTLFTLHHNRNISLWNCF